MSLTVGTALQNGKYVIQTILERQDLGITYQAIHVPLEQTVFLQTLKERSPNGTDAQQVQQGFLAGVRRLVKGQPPYAGRVLDYFVESQLPFVVLEYVSRQLPPKVEDWFSTTIQPGAAAVAGSVPVINNSTTQPILAEPQDRQRATTGTVDPGIAAQLVTVDQLSPNGATSNGKSVPPAPPALAEGRSPQKAKAKVKWLPLSLVMTSIVAGLMGASLGWVLRFDGLGKPRTNGNPIFSSEQAFPPLDQWPVQEKQEISRPETTWQPQDSPIEPAPRDSERVWRPEVAPDPIEPQPQDLGIPVPETIPDSPAPVEAKDPPAVETVPADVPVPDVIPPPVEPAPVEPPKNDFAPEPAPPPVTPPPVSNIPDPTAVQTPDLIGH